MWAPAAVLMLTMGTLNGSAQEAAKSPQPAASATREPAFDVVSIKPSGPDSPMRIQWKGPDFYRAEHVPLGATLVLGYFSVRGFMTHGISERIVNAPDWLQHDMYDFLGKVAETDVPAWQNQTQDLPLMQQMVRAALKDRCNLKAHVERKEGPVYALVPAKHAPAIKPMNPADSGQPDPAGTVGLPGGGKIVPYRRGEDPKVVYVDISMAEFAANLSNSANRPVVDRTGLAGRYTFSLTRRDTAGEATNDPEAASPWDLEKLGFRLMPITAPLDMLVIDHIEKPTAN